MNEQRFNRPGPLGQVPCDVAGGERGAGAPTTALVLVDVQAGFDSPQWGPRNNPHADANIAKLVDAFVASENPVILVRHDSRDEGSPLRPGQPGNQFKRYLRPSESALVVAKHVNSAFHGSPDLDEWLMAHGISDVVVAGITTNHCCETTARVAANLGYRVHFVLDATHTFNRVGPDGRVWTADLLSQSTAANLHDEFAEVVNTADLVS